VEEKEKKGEIPRSWLWQFDRRRHYDATQEQAGQNLVRFFWIANL